MSNIRHRTFDDKNDIDNLYKAVDLESDERQALSETVGDVSNIVDSNLSINYANIKTNVFSEVGKFLKSDGLITDDPTWRISEYIPLYSYTDISLSGIVGYAPAICFYDSNKDFISGVAFLGNTELNIKIPSNAVYVRYSARVDETEYSNFTAVAKTSALAVRNIIDSLSGLTFSVSGTTLSITDGTNTWELNA